MTKPQHPSKWRFDVIHDRDLKGFKAIPRTDQLYMINPSGQVVGRRHSCCQPWPGWWIKLRTAKSRPSQPFNRVSIVQDGQQVCAQLGRLLLETFVGPAPSSDHVAGHINGVSDDDRLENLKWVLPVDVKTGSIRRGTWAHGDRVHSARFHETQVNAIRRILEAGIAPTTLAAAMDVPQARVREIAAGLSRRIGKHDGRKCELTGETISQRTER